MNETKLLAQFITEIKYKDLKDEVIEKAKTLVLDQLGCQLAFSVKPWSEIVYKFVSSRKSGRKESTVVYYGLKTAADEAAFANATFGHGFEMDDTELSSFTHPGSVVIPSALAMGEAASINGKEFISALVAGYEAMIRIGMATRTMNARSFHNTSVVGTLGAAAASGKVLGFSSEIMLNAMGIASSECGGIGEFNISGGSVKRLHAGFAVQAGIKAALLAQLGITGPSTALEGKRGFCQAYSNEYFLEDIISDLGKEYRIMWTGNKPYCCCAGQHSVIDAAAKIKAEHNVQSEEVDEIIIEQLQREVGAVGNIIEPHDITSAQFSARFGVALRLIKGSNGSSDYTEKNIRDPELLSLTRKVRYLATEKLAESAVGGAPAIVTIKLKNGTTYQARVDYAKGTKRNLMTKKELEQKFKDLASSVLPEKRVETILKTVGNLEEIERINTLVPLLIRQ